jgi:hypothetical protein
VKKLSDGNRSNWPPENYKYPGGQRACYKAVYYTSISGILNEFSVGLKT